MVRLLRELSINLSIQDEGVPYVSTRGESRRESLVEQNLAGQLIHALRSLS